MGGDFNEEDRKKLVSDAVFYFLVQEQKRPLFKRPDVLKAIGLTGRSKELQDDVWIRAVRHLKDTFGYKLAELSEKKVEIFQLRSYFPP